METRNPITVETTVNAPVAKVWEIWSGPEHIMKWNSPSPDWHTPFAENDLRTGGKFTSTMAAKDGSMSFDFAGVYSKVELHEEMAYDMADGRKVKVLFAQDGEGTRVTETFDPESINAIEMQQAGWQAILDNFKSYTESL
jgi:uncharacterized protein YndB with AHSA1/START domain